MTWICKTTKKSNTTRMLLIRFREVAKNEAAANHPQNFACHHLMTATDQCYKGNQMTAIKYCRL